MVCSGCYQRILSLFTWMGIETKSLLYVTQGNDTSVSLLLFGFFFFYLAGLVAELGE